MESTSVNEVSSRNFGNTEISALAKPTKELRKIDWHVVKRLVVFLYYNSKMKKTGLATKCNLGYDKCVLYLDWMANMDLIKKDREDGFELISLNHKGMEIYEKNFKDIL